MMNSMAMHAIEPITHRLLRHGDYLVLLTSTAPSPDSGSADEPGYSISAYFFRVVMSNPVYIRVLDTSLAAGQTRGPGLLTSTGIQPSGQSVLSIPALNPFNIYHVGVGIRDNGSIVDENIKLGIYYPAKMQVNGISTLMPPADDLTDVTAGIPANFTIADYMNVTGVPTAMTELVVVPQIDVFFAVRNNTTAAITPEFIIAGSMYGIRVIKDPYMQELILSRGRPHIVKFGTWRPYTVAFPPEWGEPRRIDTIYRLLHSHSSSSPAPTSAEVFAES